MKRSFRAACGALNSAPCIHRMFYMRALCTTLLRNPVRNAGWKTRLDAFVHNEYSIEFWAYLLIVRKLLLKKLIEARRQREGLCIIGPTDSLDVSISLGNRIWLLIDFLVSDELIVARLVDSIEIGRQMQRHEQQRFSHSLYVHRIVLEAFGDKEDTWLGDDVSFVFRPQEHFNFRVEIGRQIRQLGAQEEEIFVNVVMMRLQFHLKGFDVVAEAHVDAGARKVAVAAETDCRTEYCIC